MPIKTCLSDLLSTRFDFGVPLEDVFPPNDIHPRLKYLFGKAYEAYIKHGQNIDNILRQKHQGSMKECLRLKEKLVLDLDYHINLEEFSPDTYFWIIRHFLGLLPIPLLPKYTKGIQFDWAKLADDCKKFLQNYDDGQKKKHVLDYEIAQTINTLPFDNFLLLNVLIVFLRKLSTKNIGRRQIFNRKSMLVLCKYYCASIFARPFRPGGYSRNDSYLPLLLYLIIRWQKISKHCESIGYPAFFLENDIKNVENYKGFGQRDNCSQTHILSNAFFNPEIISVCRNIPYFVNICNNHFKDTSCQTDVNLFTEKNSVSCSPILEESETSNAYLEDKEDTNRGCNEKIDKNDDKMPYKLAYIEEELDCSLRKNNVENENEETLYQTATDFSFNSAVTKEDHRNWENIVKETKNIVKKVEESYIYDDYETFKKEDFNQIGKNKSRSFLSKIARYGIPYTPPKNSPRQEKITSTPEKESPESDNSYVKYPDVCEDVCFKDHCHDQYENRYKKDQKTVKSDHEIRSIDMQPKTSVSQKLFRNDSVINVQADNSKQDLQNGGSIRKRKKYMLNRIRLSLEFLRALTPKKSTFKRIESRVKYRRIRNGKSNTI